MGNDFSGGTFYPDIAKDPIGSITDLLIENLKSGKYYTAQQNYRDLILAIYSRGRQGKDIRYVEKELNYLNKEADIEETSKIAARYARQLPKPADEKRRRVSTSRLEIMMAQT